MRDKFYNLLGYAGAFGCGALFNNNSEQQVMWVVTSLIIYCVGMSLTKDYDNN